MPRKQKTKDFFINSGSSCYTEPFISLLCGVALDLISRRSGNGGCSGRDVYFYPLFNLRNLLYLILPGTAKPPLSAGRAALPQNRCCLGRRIQQQGSGLTPAALLFRFKKAAPEAFASPWVGTACQTPPLPSRPRSSPAACGRHPPRRQDIPLSAP